MIIMTQPEATHTTTTLLRRTGIVLQSLLAVLVGYVLFVFAAVVVQEWLLGGVSYLRSPWTVLLAAGALTPLAAAVGGAFTALTAPARPYWHLVPMSLAIVIETTALYVTRRVDGPLWFEAGAGASLIVGGWAGAWVARRLVDGRRGAVSPTR